MDGAALLYCTAAGRPLDALTGSPEPVYLQLLKLFLERLELLDRQIEELDRMAAAALQKHEDAVIRLAQAPGFGVDSAHSRSSPKQE